MKLAVESFSHSLTYKKSPSFGIQHSYFSDQMATSIFYIQSMAILSSVLEFNCKLLCVSWKLQQNLLRSHRRSLDHSRQRKKLFLLRWKKNLMHHFQKALMKFTVFTFIFITSKQNLEALLSSLGLIMSLLKSIILLISERGPTLNSVYMKTSN